MIIVVRIILIIIIIIMIIINVKTIILTVIIIAVIIITKHSNDNAYNRGFLLNRKEGGENTYKTRLHLLILTDYRHVIFPKRSAGTTAGEGRSPAHPVKRDVTQHATESRPQTAPPTDTSEAKGHALVKRAAISTPGSAPIEPTSPQHLRRHVGACG